MAESVAETIISRRAPQLSRHRKGLSVLGKQMWPLQGSLNIWGQAGAETTGLEPYLLTPEPEQEGSSQE